MKKFLLYLKVARAYTLLMTSGIMFCYFLYTFQKYRNINIFPFLFVFCSAILFHLSVNTISEYRDCIKGIDDRSSPGPQYRLIKDPVPRRNILYLGYFCFICASFLGMIAVYYVGFELLIAGIIGAGLSLFYSEFLGYKYKALGDVGVFLAYGPVLCFSVIFSLARDFDLFDFLFSIPFGLLTVSVLLVNNIRDYEFDRKKTKTLSTVVGIKWSYAILFFIVNFSFFVIIFLIYFKAIPKTCFLSFLAYPVLFFSIKRIGKPEFVDVFGILQVLFCFFIILGFLIA